MRKSGITFVKNPVRAQLVEKIEDWPYAGEFVTIYGD